MAHGSSSSSATPVAAIERLATGAWLDRRFFRFASGFMACAAVAALAYLVLTRQGSLDAWGRPLGTDFSNIWVAGRTAITAVAASSYDMALHYRAEQAAFGDAVPFYSWHYPPTLLFLAVPLAALPYLAALAVWQIGTALPAYLVVRRILPDRDLLLASIGFPAALICVTHGHTGFLTAALFGCGLVCLERRPWLAGLCFGLLAYKPQLGLLLPVALLAGGHGRAIVAAGLTVVACIGLSGALFGFDAWMAFVDSLQPSSRAILVEGAIGWAPIQSAFAAIRLWGGQAGIAYGVQGVVSAIVAFGVIRVWRSDADFAPKAAALLTGSLLVTPYVVDYDLMLLAPAMAYLVAHGRATGFARFEVSALALAWFAPIGGRAFAQTFGVPLGFLAMAWLFVLILRAAERTRAHDRADHPARRSSLGDPAFQSKERLPILAADQP